jgi:hypothetical protein
VSGKQERNKEEKRGLREFGGVLELLWKKTMGRKGWKNGVFREIRC